MPAHGYNRKDLITTTSSGGGARLPQDKLALLSPVTGLDYPSRVDTSPEPDSRRFHYQPSSNTTMSPAHHQPQTNNRLYTLPNAGGSSIDGGATELPPNTVSLDDVWGAIRQKKERQMAKEKPKVQSFEEISPELLPSSGAQEDGPSVRIPVMESHVSPTKSVKKQKSMYESLSQKP